MQRILSKNRLFERKHFHPIVVPLAKIPGTSSLNCQHGSFVGLALHITGRAGISLLRWLPGTSIFLFLWFTGGFSFTGGYCASFSPSSCCRFFLLWFSSPFAWMRSLV